MRRIAATLAVVVALLFSAGPAWADFDDANKAYHRGDYETAFREFLRLAEKGDAWAQSNLGSMYSEGKGVPQNYGEALKWYRKAAEQGLPNAQHALGYMYFKGWGVTQDLVQYYKWLKIAKRHGMDEKKADEITNYLWSSGLLSSSEVYEAEELARNWKPKSSSTTLLSASQSAQNLVEDLRSGKSDVRASATQGGWSGIIQYWRQMKSQPDFKAIVSTRSRSYGAVGRHSAEAAVEGAIKNCKEKGGGRTKCKVYAVGDNIVQGRSQAELADAIEAYNLKVSGEKPKDTAADNTSSTTAVETEAPSDDAPLAAKLEKLKKLLEKGLITEEEAAAKRAKLLEDL